VGGGALRMVMLVWLTGRGSPLLGGVEDGVDDDLLRAEAIDDDIRSAADDEFTDVGSVSGAAEVGVKAQRLDDRHDSQREAFSGGWFVVCDVGADLAQARPREGGPKDFEGDSFFLAEAFHNSFRSPSRLPRRYGARRGK
jgi:hypothetical protein